MTYKRSKILYEGYAKKIIDIFTEAIAHDFGLRLRIGPELEVEYERNFQGQADLKRVKTYKRPDYRTFRERVERGDEAKVKSKFLSNSGVLSHFYLDRGFMEAVGAFDSSESTPLEIAKTFEKLKKYILTSIQIRGNSPNVNFQPFDKDRRFGNQTIGFEYNLSMVDIKSGEVKFTHHELLSRAFREGFEATLTEALFVGFSTDNSITRLDARFLRPTNGRVLEMKAFQKKAKGGGDFVEYDFLSSNSNGFLGMAVFLASLYNGLSSYRKAERVNGSESAHIDLTDVENASIPEFFRGRLKDSVVLRRTINSISGSNLGDHFIDSICKAREIITPLPQEEQKENVKARTRLSGPPILPQL